MDYKYKISSIREESRWICIYYDNWEDDPEGFANFIKRIKEDNSGVIMKVGIDRYAIIGAKMDLVYQYDGLFGMVVEYLSDDDKEEAIEFLEKYMSTDTNKNICQCCGAVIEKGAMCVMCGYLSQKTSEIGPVPILPTGRFKNKYIRILKRIVFIQVLLFVFSIFKHPAAGLCYAAGILSFIPALIVSVLCVVTGKRVDIRSGEKLGLIFAIINSVGLVLAILQLVG